MCFSAASGDFGSRIIQSLLPHDFSGEAGLDHDPSGIRYELRTKMKFLDGSIGSA